MTPAVWYIAHPVDAPTEAEVRANCDRARRWLAWLLAREPEHAFCVPWLPYLDVLGDDGGPLRARGLRDNCAMVARCDGIVLCGGRVSTGMQAEIDRYLITRPSAVSYNGVADLTSLGDEPPDFVHGLAGAMFNESPIEFGRAAWHRRVKDRRGAVRYV